MDGADGWALDNNFGAVYDDVGFSTFPLECIRHGILRFLLCGPYIYLPECSIHQISPCCDNTRHIPLSDAKPASSQTRIEPSRQEPNLAWEAFLGVQYT